MEDKIVFCAFMKRNTSIAAFYIVHTAVGMYVVSKHDKFLESYGFTLCLNL
jgi:hypothetical protein